MEKLLLAIASVPLIALYGCHTNKVSETPKLVVQVGHVGTVVNSVVYSADGKFLATGDGIGRIIVWDVDSGREIRSLEGHSEKIEASIGIQRSQTISSFLQRFAMTHVED